MPRNPHVQTLARCVSSHQAELIADQLTSGHNTFATNPEDPQPLMLGEERCVVRVVPIGGEWLVQSWPVSALEWDQADAADVPFAQSEVSVEFP